MTNSITTFDSDMIKINQKVKEIGRFLVLMGPYMKS